MRLSNEDLYNGLDKLSRMNNEEVQNCMLTFTIDRPTIEGRTTVSLVEYGDEINVTYDNRLYYIHRVVSCILHEQLEVQVSRIISGISETVDANWFQMFNELELYKLFGGSRTPIDLEDFKNNVHYEGYTSESPTILMFWKVVEELGQDFLSKLIKFSTGSPRPPIFGFSHLIPKYCIKESRPEKRNGYPESAACFNLLSLPNYDSKDILKKNISITIEYNTSFYTA